ncbi:MAG: hypothetical protein HZB33_16235 [Nitrospirae bacterium]|nr:hypothetical protein [Nitrospirota bacterium]
MSRIGIVRDLWDYMRVRKKFWLLPILIMLTLFGILIIFTEGTVISPFIYVLF